MRKKKKFVLACLTGASSGIGKALAYLLAEKGIPLLLSGRNKEALEAMAESLKAKVPVTIFLADLNSSSERLKLIEEIKKQTPDLMINCAGFGLYGEALSYPKEAQIEILRVNGEVVLELTLESARAMIFSNQKGTILNVSSAATFQPFPTLAVYAASKAFVTHLSLSLDEEFRSYGVRVLAACPGMVSTGFHDRASANFPRNSSFLSMTPEKAAFFIWKQIQKEKPLTIFDWKTRLAVFLSGLFLPRRWVSLLLKRILLNRYLPQPIMENRKGL